MEEQGSIGEPKRIIEAKILAIFWLIDRVNRPNLIEGAKEANIIWAKQERWLVLGARDNNR